MSLVKKALCIIVGLIVTILALAGIAYAVWGPFGIPSGELQDVVVQNATFRMFQRQGDDLVPIDTSAMSRMELAALFMSPLTVPTLAITTGIRISITNINPMDLNVQSSAMKIYLMLPGMANAFRTITIDNSTSVEKFRLFSGAIPSFHVQKRSKYEDQVSIPLLIPLDSKDRMKAAKVLDAASLSCGYTVFNSTSVRRTLTNDELQDASVLRNLKDSIKRGTQNLVERALGLSDLEEIESSTSAPPLQFYYTLEKIRGSLGPFKFDLQGFETAGVVSLSCPIRPQ